MKKKIKAFLLIYAALAVGSVVMYQFVFAAKAQVATLTSVKGSIAVKTAGETTWKNGYEKMAVGQGDTIKTGANSSAIVKFNDGSMTKVGPIAVLVINKMPAVGGGGTSLNVDSGKAWSRVRKQDSKSSFDVKTPTAIAGVRGTFFSAEAQPDNSQFDVFDGQVDVSSAANPSQTVSVKSHQRTSVAGDKPPAAPTAIPQSEEQNGRGGFSDQEFTNANFDIQVSITPQNLKPGEKAIVTAQVLENGAPSKRKVSLHLTLSGAAIFAGSASNEIDVTTDSKGAAHMEISDQVEESVAVQASMTVKVKK